MSEEEHDQESETETKAGMSTVMKVLIGLVGCGGLFVIGLGLLAALIVPQVMGELFASQTAVVRVDLESIGSALEMYAIENDGRYPDSLEALVMRDEKGARFLDSDGVPIDPWGAPYQYEPPPSGTAYKLWSFGADGQPGGEGHDADLLLTSQIGVAKADISTIYNAAEHYAVEHQGRYPATLEELRRAPGYLPAEASLIDPWGNAYFYRYTGIPGEVPELGSYGPDGVAGGTGEDEDLTWSDIRARRR